GSFAKFEGLSVREGSDDNVLADVVYNLVAESEVEPSDSVILLTEIEEDPNQSSEGPKAEEEEEDARVAEQLAESFPFGVPDGYHLEFVPAGPGLSRGSEGHALGYSGDPRR
ncbi:unnamed protein product, partial [Urochloa humidicola]